MRRIVEDLKASLTQFIAQRDDLLLLVPCADSDMPLLLKVLRDMDRESGSDLFLLFAEPFDSAGQFAAGIAARLEQEHKLINDSVQDATRRLPELPKLLVDPSTPPKPRLEAAMSYGRSLIDPRLGQHAVWAFGPAAIADEAEYLSLLAGLLPNPDILPWMRGARIVARVAAGFQVNQSPFVAARRSHVRPFAIPPNAQEDELHATAADPNAAMSDRMQAEVQLAYLDCAYSRFDEANKRFLKALAFFQWAGVPALEALVICGLGDVARREGNQQDAQYWYECAVVPAAKTSNPILMATIVQHLAALAFQQGRFADAEKRYGELVALKRAMLDEDGLAEALEWQGLSQEKQQAYDRAVTCWEEGVLVAKAFELSHRLRPLADHMRRGYKALEMHEELAAFEAELAAAG